MVNALGGTTYIITFELGVGAISSEIIKIIKSYGTWGKITENTWAVVSLSDKASQIRDRIHPYVGTNGRLFVIKSGYESAWKNPNANSEWLKKYMAN